MNNIPIMPSEYLGETMTGGGYTNTTPRKWTPEEIDWMLQLQLQGFSKEQISQSIGRSVTSIQIKLKRLGKTNGRYNADHVTEKYEMNRQFLDEINPNTILDLYCGTKSFYQGFNVVTNDIDKTIDADYHQDAFKLICNLYSQNKKYDMIDLDPYGSAYDCFDLAIKMAKKGLIITLGELGHKRWKRLDFVRSHYGIQSLEGFTIENPISHIQQIGERNKKRLIVWDYREWKNIGRVYFKVEKFKITEQWTDGKMAKDDLSEGQKNVKDNDQIEWVLG